MSDGIRVWEIDQKDALTELEPSKLDYEERIETWICNNISVLVPDDSGLLVIGRQVETFFGGRVDLLCMNADGDLVVVELKRDKTPREITAQALDYASWVQDLTSQHIEEIAAEYLQDKPLKEAFEDTFPDKECPEIINGQHSIKIVASRIDDSTERIIRYLSGKGRAINFVRFHLFKSVEGKERLVRTFVVPPGEAEENSLKAGRGKRTRSGKALQDRLEQTTEDAEREFLTKRLSDPNQEFDRLKRGLLYRVSGKIRFLVRARRSHVHVIQRGRFAGDEAFWSEHLTAHKIGFRRSAKDLSLVLNTREDYIFFQTTMENKISGFPWLLADDDSDEGENGEDEI